MQNRGREDPDWSEITREELKAYFACQILMGIKKLPRLSSYWSSDPALGCPVISGTMTKRRFMKINQYLHAFDYDELVPRGHPGYDPLQRIRQVINKIRERFNRYFNGGQNLSVDEAMIPFRGRSFLKQYLPSKPTRYGIKVSSNPCIHTENGSSQFKI